MASSQVRVRLLPGVRCFFDKLVQVKVEGLSPHKLVVLRSKVVDDRGIVFKATAQYRADDLGHVDVSRAASLGGSYTGVEPMGLFWSMLPERPHNKLMKKTALSPMQVEISALSGENGEVLASEINHREFMSEGMKRIPVKEGRLRGVLFVPPGQGPFPGILDLYTLGGGLTEPRASLLAGKGFVVLALAYKSYQDLPKNPEYLELEYFEEAVEYLRSLPEVEGPGVGVISISHSGGVAMSISSFLSHISATVCINGCNANTVIPLRYKDKCIPPIPHIMENIRFTKSGLLVVRDVLPDPEQHRPSLIPIERATCQFLFVASKDDYNWTSAFFAKQAASILKRHGKDSYALSLYPKAGHFLEVPYMPNCPSGVHAAVGKVVFFGGEPKAHSEAQLDLWERVQCFFKTHL
ncbi:acyl-coenzyme A thioesterase 2, mitochondrial [Eucyclogobius newberryi]|uniref:acyl-coenzyme A thioesterase 2, mitochondrial n=1 Tax=Eucyclogobius newberryi TaxID=166745 RepID=UPI003B5AE610